MKDDINLNDVKEEEERLKKLMVKSMCNGLRIALAGAFLLSLSDNATFKIVTLVPSVIFTGNCFQKYDCYKQRLVLTKSLTTPKYR